MVYRNTKPDSPKGQIYTRYASTGSKEALAFGRSINVDEKKMLRWFEQWGVVTPAAKESTTKQVGKKSGIKVVWTDRPVKLVARGEQCSEVRWLDTGSSQALSNNEIKFYDDMSKRA